LYDFCQFVHVGNVGCCCRYFLEVLMTRFGIGFAAVYLIALLIAIVGLRDCTRSMTGEEEAALQAGNERQATRLTADLEANEVSQEGKCPKQDWTGDVRSCNLVVRYETAEPLIEIREKYVTQLKGEGWTLQSTDCGPTPRCGTGGTTHVHASRGVESVSINIFEDDTACPKLYEDPEAHTACVESWIEMDDGAVRQFSVWVHSDLETLIPWQVVLGAIIFLVPATLVLLVLVVMWLVSEVLYALFSHGN
jgi:hypothetical protein